MSITRRLFGALAACALVSAAEARAGDFSLRAGAYTDVDSLFVGAEYRAPLQGRIYIAPNFELAFPDEGTYFSFSADVHYVFPTKSELSPWLGGGLGIYTRGHDGGGSDTKAGLNLVAGLGLRTNLKPYAQVKVVVKDDTAFVAGFGIRF